MKVSEGQSQPYIAADIRPLKSLRWVLIMTLHVLHVEGREPHHETRTSGVRSDHGRPSDGLVVFAKPSFTVPGRKENQFPAIVLSGCNIFLGVLSTHSFGSTRLKFRVFILTHQEGKPNFEANHVFPDSISSTSEAATFAGLG